MVNIPNNQTVGESLTLVCRVATVKGITSRVDIVWSSGGIQLKRIVVEAIVSSTINDTKLYENTYYISQLSTNDNERVLQCEVVIMTTPSIMATDNVTLDVTGKCLKWFYKTIN